MTKNIHPKDNSYNAQTLLTELQKAGVDLRDDPGTPGKLWRALAAGARAGLTPEFLAEIQARGEMHAEIEAVAARFEATGDQNPADLGFLLLGLFCESTPDAFGMAGDMLALLHAKRAGRTAPAEGDALAVRLNHYFQRPRGVSPAGGNSSTPGQGG